MSEPVERRPYDLATTAADYPPWEGTPRRTIVLCSHMRCGSTLLGEALYFAGGLGCAIEYFHAGFRPTLEAEWGVQDDADYLRELYRRRTDPSGTLAVKLFWTDVLNLCRRASPSHSVLPKDPCELPDLEEPLFSLAAEVLSTLFPAPVYVHLTRQDRVRQAVSNHISGVTRKWRSIPGVQDDASAREPEYDFANIAGLYSLARYCEEAWEGYFQFLGAEPYRVRYEDLATNYDGTVRALLRALDAPNPDAVAVPRMRRQASALTERFMARFLQDMAAGRDG